MQKTPIINFAALLAAEMDAIDADKAQHFHLHHKESIVIAELIRARHQDNLTQRQLAKRSGISRITIVRLENQKQSPSLRHLLTISDALGMDVALYKR